MLRVFLAGLTLFAAPAMAQEALSGDEIVATISGETVYLSTPLGGEIPLNYAPSGTVTGDGEAVGLGRFFQPRDSGRWWVEDNRLCQQFQAWYDGERLCFDLVPTGANTLRWTQTNGDTGTARIAE